jgi:Rrf2 family protein
LNTAKERNVAKLFRLPEAASLGVHATVLLAGRHNGFVSAADLAQELVASEAHLAKVMQRLVRAGIVQSTRGPKGGFTLARPADEVTLLEVYEAVEGAVEPARCVFGEPVCGRKSCVFGGMTEELDARFHNYMANARLSNLVEEKETAHVGAADHQD